MGNGYRSHDVYDESAAIDARDLPADAERPAAPTTGPVEPVASPGPDDTTPETDSDAIYIDLRQGDPSDEEIIRLLREIALERAGLRDEAATATATTSDADRRAVAAIERRNREIEKAHARLLWAQADSLSFPDDNAGRLTAMRRREQKVLTRFGFSSYEDYLRDRSDGSDGKERLDVAGATAEHAPVGAMASRRWLRPALLVLAAVVLAALVAFFIRARSRGENASVGPTAAASAELATTPSSIAERRPSTTRAPSTTSPSARSTQMASFCAAVKIYTLDNLNTLAENGVADSKRMASAYASMVSSAPDSIENEVKALGPITKKVLAQIDNGTIKTPKDMQQYLAAAPSDEVTQWIAAQQVIVPQLPTFCPNP